MHHAENKMYRPIPLKRGRPPKLKVEKVLITEEILPSDSEDNDNHPISENKTVISTKSSNNSSVNLRLPQGRSVSDEESEDEEVMAVLGSKSKEDPLPKSRLAHIRSNSAVRRGSVASRTRMPTRGKRRSKRIGKPIAAAINKGKTGNLHQLHMQPRRGRPLKSTLRLNNTPKLPLVVGQGVEIEVEDDSESEVCSETGSYQANFYDNKIERHSSVSRSSKSDVDDCGEQGDNENDDNDESDFERKRVEGGVYDDDEMSDMDDQSIGGKRIRAAAVAAMEIVAKKRLEEISDKDRERAERRNRKPYVKPFVPKGRSRRTIIFKRGSRKPTMGATNFPVVTMDRSIIYEKVYFQQGDIVYLIGHNDQIYFCQLRHIARDFNFEAIAGLMWLTPKKGIKVNRLSFNPAHYDIRDDIGEHTRKFSVVHFVMHCPLDYWYGHESSRFNVLPGSVYQRLDDPLTQIVKLPPKTLKTEEPEIKLENTEGDDKNNVGVINVESGVTVKEEFPDLKIKSQDEINNFNEHQQISKYPSLQSHEDVASNSKVLAGNGDTNNEGEFAREKQVHDNKESTEQGSSSYIAAPIAIDNEGEAQVVTHTRREIEIIEINSDDSEHEMDQLTSNKENENSESC